MPPPEEVFTSTSPGAQSVVSLVLTVTTGAYGSRGSMRRVNSVPRPSALSDVKRFYGVKHSLRLAVLRRETQHTLGLFHGEVW